MVTLMARLRKDKLDYFSFDTDFFKNDKIEYLNANYPNIGPIIFIRILCRIYSNSYYLEWNDRVINSLFVKSAIDKNKIVEIVQFLLDEELFDRDCFETHTILTSKTIQDRYVMSVIRRKFVTMYREYLLINPNGLDKFKRKPQFGEIKITSINSINDNINSYNDSINGDNVGTMPTPVHKVKQSKVKDNVVTTTSLVPNGPKKAAATKKCAAFNLSDYYDGEIDELIDQVIQYRQINQEILNPAGLKMNLIQAYKRDAEMEVRAWVREVGLKKKKVAEDKDKKAKSDKLQAEVSDRIERENLKVLSKFDEFQAFEQPEKEVHN